MFDLGLYGCIFALRYVTIVSLSLSFASKVDLVCTSVRKII